MKKYDRLSAVEYAFKWWNKTNPNYYNYDRIGGDCTNFISQCLFAGSRVMNYQKTFGWYYINANEKSPSWTGVDFLAKFLLNNKMEGPTARLCKLEEIELGDIIQIRQEYYFNHTLLVTKISNNYPQKLSDIFVTAHSFNVLNKNLTLYQPKELRLLKITSINYKK